MKLARFVLKIVGASLALAGGVCLLIGYLDKITDPHRFTLCRRRPSEYDDYADVDEY